MVPPVKEKETLRIKVAHSKRTSDSKLTAQCLLLPGNNTIRFIFTAERRTLPRGPVGDNALFGGRGWKKKAP
ncbi:hypothetical protein CDAR_184791 [Caerostris darwini]|uniref:Uncharacterized protein n=1 Tax=Caerostris darwini TaxID=1538125 RepID=A0AAV4ST04_9ARAC|nr:hypothetical protein CDAR_184791 [Caerostris darwini]